MAHERLESLILVPGYAPLQKGAVGLPENIALLHNPSVINNFLYLEKFQQSEGKDYVRHTQTALEMAVEHPNSLVVFSGGVTREKGSWSEAATNLVIAEQIIKEKEKIDSRYRDVRRRLALDEGALDSLQNVVGGLIIFQALTDRQPKELTVIGHGFKKARFEDHTRAVYYPLERLTYIGATNPVDITTAVKGELATQEAFHESPLGIRPDLQEKRRERNKNNVDQQGYYGNVLKGTDKKLLAFV